MTDSNRFLTTLAGTRRTAAWMVVGAALLAGGAGTAHALRDAPGDAARTATLPGNTLPASFADLVEATSPSVVSIRTEGTGVGNAAAPRLPEGLPAPFRRFFEHHGGGMPHGGAPRRQRGAGSGFIIDSSGLVVTNHHVIEDAERITVVLHDGTTLPATVRGVDERTDLALLEVESEQPLTPARFGDSDAARTGDWVVAVGNPFGLGGTYTAGIISARGRDIGSSPEDDFLQIDAPINRGNSGGALFNVRGEVVGVNTAIFSPNGGNVGIGFAVPANVARHVVESLASDGRVARGWLGVRIQGLTPALAEGLGLEGTDGAVVVAIEPGSPAERAELRPGDVVLSVDEEPVRTTRDLARLIAKRAEGTSVTLEAWREGKAESLKVNLGELPTDVSEAPAADDPAAGGLGLTLAPITPDTARRYGAPSADGPGALIVEVAPDSAAARADLRPGMVIRRVGSETVTDPSAVVRAVRAAREDDAEHLVMLVETPDGGPAFVAVPLA